MNTPIKVSVCVVTYNQEPYIEECIRSILNQDVDFRYEIIVGDDDSKDGTRDVIRRLYNERPDVIVPVFHDRNVGALANVVSVYRRAQGEYIAHLDGDDFMAQGKLRKQVDVLDVHPECTICSHDVIWVDKNSNVISKKARFKQNSIKDRDFLIGNLPFFAHSSKLFRNDATATYYDDLPASTVDFELHLRHIRDGSIFHISEFLGSYRLFTGLATFGSKISPILPAATRRVFTDLLNCNDTGYSDEELKTIYSASILRYAIGSLKLGDLCQGKEYSEESWRIKKYSTKQMLVVFYFRLPLAVRKLGILAIKSLAATFRLMR